MRHDGNTNASRDENRDRKFICPHVFKESYKWFLMDVKLMFCPYNFFFVRIIII